MSRRIEHRDIGKRLPIIEDGTGAGDAPRPTDERWKDEDGEDSVLGRVYRSKEGIKLAFLGNDWDTK